MVLKISMICLICFQEDPTLCEHAHARRPAGREDAPRASADRGLGRCPITYDAKRRTPIQIVLPEVVVRSCLDWVVS